MYGCSCGFDGNCLSTECGLLRRIPKDPRATWGDLLRWGNEKARYNCLERKPPKWLRTELTRLYDEAETVYDYLDAYQMMELAGMIYHTVGLGTEQSTWRERNGNPI
jgi:hypothetical protein